MVLAALTAQEAIFRAAQEIPGHPELLVTMGLTAMARVLALRGFRATAVLPGLTALQVVLAIPDREPPTDRQVPRAIQEA